VLLLNPRSGGGKAERFGLVDEARARGVEPILLGPGDDLAVLARDAVAGGADVLGMAGGDGSQALVAGIAAEHDLPFVCIPAGTRNHLALDLGVDRDDVVGALDAYVDGYERRVDLATVNDQVFVNNVSLGVYAKVVQSDAYRDDKVGTVAEMLPDLLGPDCEPFDLRFDSPPDGAHDHADLVLVSNNRYELERIGGFGSRARMDEGILGIVTVEVRTGPEVAALVAAQTAGRISRFPGFRAWTAPTFEVRSDSPVEAGIDGEAVVLPAPLRFAIRPAALRVRIAPHHPGRSPALVMRERHNAAGLLRVALGRGPRGDGGSQDLGRSGG
jgi:diacylglycerol kinase family enzyme